MKRVELVGRIFKAVGIKKKPGFGYLTKSDLLTILAFCENKPMPKEGDQYDN